MEIGELGGSTALGLQLEDDFEVLIQTLGKYKKLINLINRDY